MLRGKRSYLYTLILFASISRKVLVHRGIVESQPLKRFPTGRHKLERVVWGRVD